MHNKNRGWIIQGMEIKKKYFFHKYVTIFSVKPNPLLYNFTLLGDQFRHCHHHVITQKHETIRKVYVP